MSIIKIIEEAVAKNASKNAYIYNEQAITYKQLWDIASEKAKLLKRQGKDPVIIYGHKGIDMVISILACIKAKRTYVPIDFCTPVERIEKIINITKASLLIKNEPISIDKIDICNLDELSKFSSFSELNYTNTIIYIMFTSGSTGNPKGVPITENNLLNFVTWISQINPLNEYKNINVLNQANFCFDLSVADFFYSFCNGHTLISIDKKSYENYTMFDTIKKYNINLFVITPTFMKLCLLNKDFNEQNFPSIKCIYFCGEQLETKLVKKIFDVFPKVHLINAYGPTEATSAVSAIEITKNDLDEELLPIGKTDNFATEIIIDNNEIILKGESVFNGYLDKIDGGYYNERGINCYKTGDIGYIKNNKLYCKGRIDEQIKFKGYRIELKDVEKNINNINGVLDSIVIAKYNNEKIVKFLKAFVILDDKHSIEYVKQELKKKIPDYMIPKQIIQISEIPINNNMKISRELLKKYD